MSVTQTLLNKHETLGIFNHPAFSDTSIFEISHWDTISDI